MTDEQIEKFLITRFMTKDILSKEILVDLLDYKARHIKARIPAIVFRQASEILKERL